jgi:hypothetical protein
VDFEIDNLHVKRISFEDLVSYVYIVRVNVLAFISLYDFLT